jgi:hypothetical protein
MDTCSVLPCNQEYFDRPLGAGIVYILEIVGHFSRDPSLVPPTLSGI